MQIANVEIRNFRCIRHASCSFNAYTAIIGSNNSGKSSLLKAVEIFFSSTPKVDVEDFYMHDVNNTIEIGITFENLTPVELEQFGSAVRDGRMTVARYFGGEAGMTGIYGVEANVMADFTPVREETNGTKRRSLYAELRPTFDLPAASGEAIDEALDAWERANPDQLTPRKVRGFFGAPNVANGKLNKKTTVRLIPAVRDAKQETVDPKSGSIIGLISDIRRQSIENRQEYSEILEDASKRIRGFVQAVEAETLAELSDDLSNLLKQYYPDSEVHADLPPPDDLKVSFPNPSIRIEHRRVASSVERLGHGLQRAVLFSVVQFLAEHWMKSDEEDKGEMFNEPASDIIVLLEEPEIYQHPQKQRVIADVLESLTAKFNEATGIRMQVILCTHSEKFVNIKNIDALRAMSTIVVEEENQTSVSCLRLETLRDHIFVARGGVGKPMALETFRASLHVFSEAVSEGFFAERVLLVEGVGDKAVLEGAYLSRGRNVQREGLAIIPVEGKTKLDKPFQTFIDMGIRCYCVFDNDQYKEKKRTAYNELLQRIAGIADPVKFPIGVHDKFAAFSGNLENYLREACADKFEEIRKQVAASFDLDDEDIGKSPAALSALCMLARDAGVQFAVLDQIVNRVDAL